MPIPYEDLIEPIFYDRLVAFAPFTDEEGVQRMAMGIAREDADMREGIIQEYQAILAIHKLREHYDIAM